MSEDDCLSISNHSNIPSCAYCNLTDPQTSLVHCTTCDRWFCNGKGHNIALGSHAIIHFIKSKHRECTLHPESPLEETLLECYHCGNSNIFVLGFVSSIEDKVVVLLCRDPCISHSHSIPGSRAGTSLADEFDVDNWNSIVQERSFPNWLVTNVTVTENSSTNVYTPSFKQIVKLESIWKTYAGQYDFANILNLREVLSEIEYNEQLEQTDPLAVEDEMHIEQILSNISSVRLNYDSVDEYYETYSNLILAEANYDKMSKSHLYVDNIRVRWETSLSTNKLAYFSFFYNSNDSAINQSLSAEDLRVVVGDELKLMLSSKIRSTFPEIQNPDGSAWSVTGNVIKIVNEEICIEFVGNVPAMSIILENIDRLLFHVEFVWKSVSFDRMQRAIKSFVYDEQSVSGLLFHKLLGSDETSNQTLTLRLNVNVSRETNFDAPNLPALNPSQSLAVRKALTNPLSLIQGPPGTGKSVTSASIVYWLTQYKLPHMGQILVTAPSNIAVDHLCEKIEATGLKVIRICAKSREFVETSTSHLSLHNKIKKLQTKEQVQMMKLLSLKETIGELNKSDEKKLCYLRNSIERDLILKADVICTTCSGAGDPRLKDIRFKMVLIDEATQAVEPECLIPIVKGCKQLILVGDHCQLGPVIMCKAAAKLGLSQSLFERLVFLNIRPVRLEVQYRMHPCLADFPSQTFYDGSLQNGVALNDRIYEGIEDFPWPRLDLPMFFYHCTGTEEISSSGTSYLNRSEANGIEKIITAWLQKGLNPSQIGVITPYEGQRVYIRTCLSKSTVISTKIMDEIEVASVDAFQGREKDFVILSCVRSNECSGIGFLNDPRRLNVALTRARYALVVCGNGKVLGKHYSPNKISLWFSLLVHFQRQNVLVEGPLNSLRPANIHLAPPPTHFRNRDFD